MPSIEPDKHSKQYHIRFRDFGTEYKRSLRTKDRRTAEAALTRVEETLRLLEVGRLEMPPEAEPGLWIVSDGKVSGKAAVRKVATLKELFETYVENSPPGHHEENSAETEELHRTHLLRVLGGGTRVAAMRP